METLTDDKLELLLTLARASIRHGLEKHCPLAVNQGDYPAVLKRPGASFVTLHLNNELRGCIGTLSAYRPLVEDIAANAYASAFSDPRFAPLQQEEFEALDIHLSILSEPEEMHFSSQEDLIRQIRPGVDGLILIDGVNKGTFLPSVWESLATPALFLSHLKQKAGLAPNHWSDTLRVQRYSARYYP